MTDIPGAPKLTKPVLITGKSGGLISEGHGFAAPAYFDWDNDGLKDLLIGEFGSGMQHGRNMGNFIRVYLNTGAETEPEFDNRFDYARPPFPYRALAHGTPYSVDQYCCIGFTPQFIDLNTDGLTDMITGQYQGEVSWFQKTNEGFLPPEPLLQEGNPRDPDRKSYLKNQRYWLYSAASFGDFTGDGLPDLIVGGLGGLRISKNEGTPSEPRFGRRELLLDINGDPLRVYEYTKEELDRFEVLRSHAGQDQRSPAGEVHVSPFVTDWDNDGTLDLLVTNGYLHSGLDVVTFFKGVMVAGHFRFQPGIPLFTAADGTKAFPGSSPRVFVTDWNDDGVYDLLIGTSIPTVNGTLNDHLLWNWAKNAGISIPGKDPANLSDGTLSAEQLKRYKDNVKLPEGLTIEDFMTIRHRGYVFLMLGQSGKESAP